MNRLRKGKRIKLLVSFYKKLKSKKIKYKKTCKYFKNILFHKFKIKKKLF